MRWIASVLTLAFCVSFYKNATSVADLFIYPRWNQYLLWMSLILFVAGGILQFLTKFKWNKLKLLVSLSISAVVLNFISMRPHHEVDQLFYKQLQAIESQDSEISMADKIQLCEHVKDNYTNLKNKMLLQLEKTCADSIIKLSKRSSQELNQAFNWAYTEYAKKPKEIQAEALVCLYAETNQKEFAVELSEKHSFQKLTGRLKSMGNCREFGNRQIAGTYE